VAICSVVVSTLQLVRSTATEWRSVAPLARELTATALTKKHYSRLGLLSTVVKYICQEINNKIEVVRVFDLTCANVVRIPVEKYNLCASYSRMLFIAIVGLLRNTVVCSQKIITSKWINSTFYHMQLVLDEKVGLQPDPYIRHTALQGALLWEN